MMAAVDGLRDAGFPLDQFVLDMNWHEKPHWPDTLFFAGRGHKRRHAADAKFSITPPRYDRME